MGKVNSLVYEEDWADRLQQEPDEPTIFKQICTVDISDKRVFHNPWMADPSVISIGRGTTYTYQTVAQTDDNITIDTAKGIPQFIDRADLAQSGYAQQMYLAERQGVLLNEEIETAIYADHGSMTEFGAEDLAGTAGGSTDITVSATNIDDIIRVVRKTIRVAEGESLYRKNGGFFVWRPVDFEKLEQFAQANGFTSADKWLELGSLRGMHYMGFDHYSSNLLPDNHVIAGVNKAPWVGILRATYGQIMVDTKDPQSASGISVVSRVDFKENIWVKMKPVVFNVNVA